VGKIPTIGGNVADADRDISVLGETKKEKGRVHCTRNTKEESLKAMMPKSRTMFSDVNGKTFSKRSKARKHAPPT